MIGVNTISIGESVVSHHKSAFDSVHRVRFVDRNMLMQFHFGLGVGHIYFHYRVTQAGPQHASTSLQPSLTDGVEEPANNVEVDEYEYEDDGTEDGLDIEGSLSSSNESLLEQFDQMYDSEVDLDYEN